MSQQYASIKKLNYYPYPNSFRMMHADPLEFSLSRYICSHETPTDLCESESTAKIINPEFMKEMGILYRTSGAADAKKRAVSLRSRLTQWIKK